MKHLTITYINFWRPFTSPDEIIHRYIAHSFAKYDFCLNITSNNFSADIVVASVFGDIRNVLKYSGFKILFTGENHDNNPVYKIYDNNSLIRDVFDVFIGFDRDEDDFKIRVPLWIFYYPFFQKHDCAEYKQISENHISNIEDRRMECCLVATSDLDGFRKRFLESASNDNEGIYIECPSRIGKNTNITVPQGSSNKHNYIKQFMFNLCPENGIRNGYITEKIIQAAFAGCIPIYRGDISTEVDVLNQARIIYVHDIQDALLQVKNIMNNPHTFFSQPIFTNKAIDAINAYIDKLDLLPRKYISQCVK